MCGSHSECHVYSALPVVCCTMSECSGELTPLPHLLVYRSSRNGSTAGQILSDKLGDHVLFAGLFLINGPIDTFNQVLWIYFIKVWSHRGCKSWSTTAVLFSGSAWSFFPLFTSEDCYFSAPLRKWAKISLSEENPDSRKVNKSAICASLFFSVLHCLPCCVKRQPQRLSLFFQVLLAS